MTIPKWVKDDLTDKISSNDYSEFNGNRIYYAERRKECNPVDGCDGVEMWKGTIDRETADNWYGNVQDPTEMRDGITWNDLNIEEL